jgi:hypothetical protein
VTPGRQLKFHHEGKIMELTPVKSSNVAAVGHEGETLEVQFNNGTRYRYAGVPRETFDALIGAESVGRFFNTEIKPNFQFERVDEKDAAE